MLNFIPDTPFLTARALGFPNRRVQRVQVSRADLSDIFAGMVAPVLHEMFGPKPKAATATAKATTSGRDLDAIARATVEAFRGFNLGVEVASVIEARSWCGCD